MHTASDPCPTVLLACTAAVAVQVPCQVHRPLAGKQAALPCVQARRKHVAQEQPAGSTVWAGAPGQHPSSSSRY
jgi:hypothetical protein